MMLLVNATLVGRARWGWAEGECPTRRLDLGAVAEDGFLEENRSDAPEGCKAQPLKVMKASRSDDGEPAAAAASALRKYRAGAPMVPPASWTRGMN